MLQIQRTKEQIEMIYNNTIKIRKCDTIQRAFCVHICSSNIIQQGSQNHESSSDPKTDSRNAGLTQKPEKEPHFDPENSMKSTSIKCKPRHCDSCFVVRKVVQQNPM